MENVILFIEDDDIDWKLVSKTFNNIDPEGIYKITRVSNGEEGLKYLQENPKPFMVITDAQMPLMDGIEFVNELKKNSELLRKSTPIIFLSGTTDPQFINKIYELHCQGFFQKPNSIEDYVNLFRKIISYWKDSSLPEF